MVSSIRERRPWRLAAVAPLLAIAAISSCSVPPPCPQRPVDPAFDPATQTDSGPSRWRFTSGGVLLRYESDDPFGNQIDRLWRVDPDTMAETSLLGTPGVAAEVDGSTSTDGRFVAVRSAVSLDGSPDAHPDTVDAWLLDTQTGDATRITAGNGSVEDVTVSDDGSRVAFASWATDLTPEVDLNPANLGGGGPSWQGVFVWDRAAGQLTRLTNEPGEASFGARISADGQRVAFLRIGGRFLVDADSGAISTVPPVSGVDQYGFDVDIPLALRPDRAVAIDTARAIRPGDTDGSTDLYVISPSSLTWREATPGAARLSTYSGRYPDNEPRYPFFLVGPVNAISAHGDVTVALEGGPDTGTLVRRTPTGSQVLTGSFEWHHSSRVAISPDGRTVVATLARFQDDRYCGVRPWRTFVWTFPG